MKRLFAKKCQITREEKADKGTSATTVTDTDGTNARLSSDKKQQGQNRSRSRRRTVTDAGQTNNRNNNANEEDTSSTQNANESNKRPDNTTSGDRNHVAIPTITSDPPSPEESSQKPNNVSFNHSNPNRPTAGGVAFPFKLSSHLVENGRNASTVTLESQAGVVSPQGDDAGKQLHESAEDEAQDVPIVGTSETGKEVGGDGKLNAEGVGSQDIPDGNVDGNGEGATEGRRGTLEDAKGVLHHGIVSSSSGNKS